MSRKVHVVINPGSGQPKPVLHTLNRVFRAAQVDWDISLTHQSGDAERFARQAAEAGADVVAAFGGDGTVMEVARGLFGTQVPLAILPGGTANLMSVELGIPKGLEEAAAIAADPESPVRQIDAGRLGETYFLLRVGMGFPAHKVKHADRRMKDRWGLLAYSLAAVKAIKVTQKAHYRLTLDGQQFEVDTPACQVYNAGNMGVASATPARNIDVSDGLLDVLALRETALKTITTRGTEFTRNAPIEELFDHWQARLIHIEADPPQLVQVDGEMAGHTPVSIEVIPQILPVLVPVGV
jgi:YegS/Rv2252/BmrU family lipid kinase